MPFSIEDVPSQKGRIAIVTGANTGIGFETTLGLAGKDMKIIMACKNLERADNAKKFILGKLPHADLEVMIIDLASLASVREFASEFLSRYSRLDLLINNAGIMMPPYSKTMDGFESQIGVNYFGHFLLTGLLLEVIIKTPGSRIISLGSNAHKNGIINFDDLQSEKHYSAMGAYRQSKLACMIFAFELQRRLEGAGLKTLSVAAHPGVSMTELVRYMPKWLIRIAIRLAFLFTHSPQKGALPVLYAALGDDVNGADYLGPLGPGERTGEPGKAKAMPHSRDKEIAKKLWETSERLTGFRSTIH